MILTNTHYKVGPYVVFCNNMDGAQVAPVSAVLGFTD